MTPTASYAAIAYNISGIDIGCCFKTWFVKSSIACNFKYSLLLIKSIETLIRTKSALNQAQLIKAKNYL